MNMVRNHSVICSYCKRVKYENDYWRRVVNSLNYYPDLQFSHGICPECYEKHLKPQILAIDDKQLSMQET